VRDTKTHDRAQNEYKLRNKIKEVKKKSKSSIRRRLRKIFRLQKGHAAKLPCINEPKLESIKREGKCCTFYRRRVPSRPRSGISSSTSTGRDVKRRQRITAAVHRTPRNSSSLIVAKRRRSRSEPGARHRHRISRT
jgi:hypothetical protein